MDRAREAHWQDAWAKARLSTATVDPSREKFFAIVAYPGSSGFLHVGHLRGLAYADVLHRYHRLAGRSVFFPTGTHATGLPAVTFAQKVRERDPTIVQQLEAHEVPESEWSKLADPEYAGRFLGRTYLAAYREFGLLVDEDAYVTTLDEDYQAFIGWQFRRLDRAGALGQAPHFASVCPVCGPVSVDPSETDLSRGGQAEWLLFHTVPFAVPDGRYLLAATLRPETVFGATNLWLSPDGALQTWHHADQRFLVAPAGGRKLLEQYGGHLGAEVPVRDLLGTSVVAPLSGRSIPVLESALVDPEIGTGVVMSVPAHAPADWVALAALSSHDRHLLPPVESIIELDGATLTPSERELSAGSGFPAERAARALHVKDLSDTAALDAATERLYRLELLRGRMRSDLLGGRPVAAARPEAVRLLSSDGRAPDVRQFSEPVVCRNGHEVIIRRVPDQWFIRYSDPVWKEKLRGLVARLRVAPEEYGRELGGIVDWLGDRPCTRRGRWLGTPFPKDESWVIEPIADSTLYPAYFPVRPFVARGRVPLAALTDEFFDFVFLGEGAGEPSLPKPLQEEVRSAFRYWYPLDLNIAGKEHKRVHFPVFLATHSLLLPPELQPQGLFVHGWLTGPGGSKISKKELGGKGGTISTLRGAFDRWGADALRLFYATSASPSQDVDWDPETADAASRRLDDLTRIALQGFGAGGGGPPELERWLSSRAHELLAEYAAAIERCEIRDAAEVAFAHFPRAARRFIARGGAPGPALRAFTSLWIQTMSPFTPHLAEELGEGHFPGLVAASRLPAVSAFARHPEALAEEAMVDLVEEDLRKLLKPAEARGEHPPDAILFVAAPWKRTVEGWMREGGSANPPSIKQLLERAQSVPELAAYRAEIARYVGRVAPRIRSEAAPEATDDLAVLRSAAGYLARRLEFRSVDVVREEEGESLDPTGRRDRARPGRPAIYLTGGRDGAPPERRAAP